MTVGKATETPGLTGGSRILLLILAHGIAIATIASIAYSTIGGISAGESILEDLPFVALLVVTLVVGWLLAVRLPRHPVGWIILAVPALFTVSAPLNLLADALRTTAPDLVRWIDWYNGTDSNTSWSWIPPVWLLLSQLPLRFPDGRLPSPRWRWFSWLTIAGLVAPAGYIGMARVHIARGVPNPAYVPLIAHLTWLFPVSFGLLAVSFVGSIASLFVRYHRAASTQRAQLRWILWAVAIAVADLVASWLVPALSGLEDLVLVLYALIPIAIAIAVLRYRLYEIDRLISRTASYAIVTLVVVGTYAVIVLLVGLLLPKLPSVAVALATLAAAGVFLPVLRWVRRFVDRLFNRAQYNAERVVDAFGERIRNGADPHTAGADLSEAVRSTLQPSVVGIWTVGSSR